VSSSISGGNSSGSGEYCSVTVVLVVVAVIM
jgi:hypothetical protein